MSAENLANNDYSSQQNQNSDKSQMNINNNTNNTNNNNINNNNNNTTAITTSNGDIPSDVQSLIHNDFDTTPMDQASVNAMNRIKMYQRILKECPAIFHCNNATQMTRNFESLFCQEVMKYRDMNSSIFVLRSDEYDLMSMIVDRYSGIDKQLRESLVQKNLINTGEKGKTTKMDDFMNKVKQNSKKLSNYKANAKNAYSLYEKQQKKLSNARNEINEQMMVNMTNDLIQHSRTFKKFMDEWNRELETFNKSKIILNLLNVIWSNLIIYKKSSYKITREILQNLKTSEQKQSEQDKNFESKSLGEQETQGEDQEVTENEDESVEVSRNEELESKTQEKNE